MRVDVLTGDCRKVLETLPAQSVDLVLADPPYVETSLAWDKSVDGWLAPVRRVMKRSASLWCFGSLKFFILNREEFDDWTLAQDVVWEKHNGSNSRRDRFRRVHEMAAQFYPSSVPWSEIYKQPVYTYDATARTVRSKKRPPHWNRIASSTYVSEDGGPRLMRSVFHARSCHGDAVHPTQKPVAILQPLIKFSCPQGGLVLDPFAGSGSTGVAAQIEGCEAVLIERDVHYAEVARRRIQESAPLLSRVAS